MAIRREKGLEVIKSSGLRFGFEEENPLEKFRYIDLYSDDLSISTTLECKMAEDIARKYNLHFMLQDFGPGEGVHPDYKPVFVASCYSEDELKDAVERLKRAVNELENKLLKQ